MYLMDRLVISVLIFIYSLLLQSFAQTNSSDLEKLALDAELILVGKVSQQTSSWNEDKSRIYTRTTIEVDEYLKGNSGESSVIVKTLGGEVGDVGELYSHTPQFQDKEEVLLFLTNNKNDSDFKVLNGVEGKIAIVTDTNTGEKVTTSNIKVNSIKAKIKSYINE